MVLIMIASILLVIVVMAQNPNGGVLTSTFGGAYSAHFVVKRTNDFMEKSTWTLGAVIIVLILISVVVTGKPKQAAPVIPTAPTETEAPANQTAPASKTTAPVSTPATK